ncbi:MAG: LON peptidase substrate-binding domain-containing protein [Candidatus Dormibacteria bacterium]
MRIPLFPLGIVLFPHMPLSLHIFEDRYRVMMRDCQEQGMSFGIVAIREGSEVGGGARPYEVGTLAQFHEVEELDDGRYRLVVTGASRFRVARMDDARPYPVGSVRYLEDVSGEDGDLSPLTNRVARAFAGYASAIARLGGGTADDLEIPDDPELLSYLVAASLQIELPLKQDLLELDGAADRLRRCLRLLQREAAVLDAMLAHRDAPVGTFSPN